MTKPITSKAKRILRGCVIVTLLGITLAVSFVEPLLRWIDDEGGNDA